MNATNHQNPGYLQVSGVRATLSVWAILFCSIAGVASGQDNPETAFTPKSYDSVDERGVDLAQRAFSVGHTISIGDPANGGMSYTLNYSGWTWWPHRSVMAFAKYDQITDPVAGTTADVWALYYRGHTEQIYWNGTNYAGESGSRMTFCGGSGPCAAGATLADGTVLTFDPTPISTSETGTIFLLTSAVKPTGERLDYYYVPGTYSIQAITSNFGYQLRYIPRGPVVHSSFQPPSSVVLFNMAIDPCAPTAASCSFTRTWPRLTFEYGSSGISAITETGGARTVYSYGPTSQLLEYIDGPGTRDTSITYQNCGPLPPFGQCNAGGEYVGGFRVHTVSKGGRTWTYSWDPALVNSSNPEHGVRVTSATGNVGYRTLVTTFFGNSLFDIYPMADRLISVRDELSRTTSFQIGGQLNLLLVKITHPEGNGLQYAYDQRGNLYEIRTFAKPGSGLADQYTYIERAENGATTQCLQPALCNKVLRIRDPRGYVTRYGWNPLTGQLLNSESGLEGPSSSLTCALGTSLCPKAVYNYTLQSAYFYNSAGQMSAATPISMLSTINQCENASDCGSGEQIVTTFGHGAAGVANNLLVRTTSIGKAGVVRTVSYAYDPVGNLVEIDGARTDVSDIARFAWDLDRRPTDDVFADGSAARRTYSAEGYLATTSRGTSTGIGQFTAVETISNEYDGGGNLAKTTSPAGVTQRSYDGAARPTCTAVRMNPSVYGSLPSDACTLSAQGVNGADRITKNVYDAAGQKTVIQRAYGTPLVQNYSTFAYTQNGKEDWVQDANGNRTDYIYDGFDRLARQNFPSATLGANAPNPDDNEQYGYDPNGNRTTLKLRSGETISYTIDPINRESRREFPGTVTPSVHSAYDLLSRLRSIRHLSAAGSGVLYAYDAWGGILTETAYGRILAFASDEAGNRTRITWPDSNYVQFTFDAMNRMDQVRENGATSGPALLADYSYDSLGRKSGITRGNGTTSVWNYDGASRLSTLDQNLAGSGHDLAMGFTYNNASQALTRSHSNTIYQFAPVAQNTTYVPNGLNRYTASGGSQFTYDPRGNLTNNAVRAFSYNLENYLIRVDAASGSPTQLSLAYDPRGRLRQTVGTATTEFLYAGDQLVAEFNGSGTVVNRYVHGASPDEPLVWYEGSGLSTRRWLHANHQGSIVATTDSSGTLVGTPYSYSVYGEPDVSHGWSGSRFRFTGQIILPEAQLYHFKARTYDPKIGRFLQTDPVGTKDDINLYAYSRNDPLNRVDNAGTWSAAVHEQVMIEAFGKKIGRSMTNHSVYQDVAMGEFNYMHYLRDPGQKPGAAILSYRNYVENNLRRAKSMAEIPDKGRVLTNVMMKAFTNAVHAIMDSYSPVHNKGGTPQEYDPSWGITDAMAHGHSPLDSTGGEGTDDLTPATKAAMIRKLRAAYDYVFKNGEMPDVFPESFPEIMPNIEPEGDCQWRSSCVPAN